MKDYEERAYTKIATSWFVGTLAKKVSDEINDFVKDAGDAPIDKNEMVGVFCVLVKKYTK